MASTQAYRAILILASRSALPSFQRAVLHTKSAIILAPPFQHDQTMTPSRKLEQVKQQYEEYLERLVGGLRRSLGIKAREPRQLPQQPERGYTQAERDEILARIASVTSHDHI